MKITKKFGEYPFAHRAPKHSGHCRLIHGHSWYFELCFSAQHLDENGFVLDFGKLGSFKKFLADNFDHTLVLNQDDPTVPAFLCLQEQSLLKLVLVPSCSAEGLARFVFDWSLIYLNQATSGRVKIESVTVFESELNSAYYDGK